MVSRPSLNVASRPETGLLNVNSVLEDAEVRVLSRVRFSIGAPSTLLLRTKERPAMALIRIVTRQETSVQGSCGHSGCEPRTPEGAAPTSTGLEELAGYSGSSHQEVLAIGTGEPWSSSPFLLRAKCMTLNVAWQSA